MLELQTRIHEPFIIGQSFPNPRLTGISRGPFLKSKDARAPSQRILWAPSSGTAPLVFIIQDLTSFLWIVTGLTAHGKCTEGYLTGSVSVRQEESVPEIGLQIHACEHT